MGKKYYPDDGVFSVFGIAFPGRRYGKISAVDFLSGLSVDCGVSVDNVAGRDINAGVFRS